MLVTSIFFFSQNVFKASFLRVVESRDCVVELTYPTIRKVKEGKDLFFSNIIYLDIINSQLEGCPRTTCRAHVTLTFALPQRMFQKAII